MKRDVLGAKSAAEPRSPPEFRTIHELGENQLLPAFCPLCEAPGVRPMPIATCSAAPLLPTRSKHETVDAFYCELCADHLDGLTTRKIAFSAGAALLTLTIATATALAWGSRDLVWQLGVAVLVPVVCAALLSQTTLYSERPPLVLLPTARVVGGAIALRLACFREPYARVLTAAGVNETIPLESEQQCSVPRSSLALTSAIIALVGIGWLALVHSLGSATLRVIQSGEEEAIVLLDARRVGAVSPTNFEDPAAGRFARVLGGRRSLALVSRSGKLLHEETLTIWPGVTYVLANLPSDTCLFIETLSYGAGGASRTLQVLPGIGPVWALPVAVDSWFAPLALGAKSQATRPPADDPLATSGGTRRALRLLSCEKR